MLVPQAMLVPHAMLVPQAMLEARTFDEFQTVAPPFVITVFPHTCVGDHCGDLQLLNNGRTKVPCCEMGLYCEPGEALLE